MKLSTKLTCGTAVFIILAVLVQIYLRRLWNPSIPAVSSADLRQWWWAFLVFGLILLDISFYAGFFLEQSGVAQRKIGLATLALAGAPVVLSFLSSLLVYQGTCTYKRPQPCSYLDFMFDFVGGYGLWIFGSMLWFLGFIAVWGAIVGFRELSSYSVT